MSNIIKDILLYYNNNQLRITTPSFSVHYILNIIYQIQFMIFCCFDGEDMRPNKCQICFTNHWHHFSAENNDN